jgi:XTP/dITP diphosphohydrolase
MSSRPKIVLGTHNAKKLVELSKLLAPAEVELCTLDGFPDAIEVVEDGETFAANAALKATQQARHLGEWVLAEDSGLAVDAIAGQPGVYSARYSGAGATDASNNSLLLEKLADTPEEKRSAMTEVSEASGSRPGNDGSGGP